MDVRELVPRVRRAIEGVVIVDDALTADQVEQLAADAICEVIFYTGGLWGFTIVVTERDDITNAPTHWAIVPDIDEPTQTVVAVQAALDYFFHEFRNTKTQENITNEGASWEYQTSANLVNEQLKLLRGNRDDALKAIFASNPVVPRFSSFIEARDAQTSAILEPYIDGDVRGEMMGARSLDLEQIR